MNAELIAVGTELLLVDTIKTDAAAVARLLSELGINVYWQTVVGDNRARLEQAVQLARTRADLIITTGGLGPTCDDLTKVSWPARSASRSSSTRRRRHACAVCTVSATPT